MKRALQAVVLLMAIPLGRPASCYGPPKTLDEVYKGLSNGPLRNARLATLPAGILLRSGQVVIAEKQLRAEVARLPEASRKQVRGFEIVVLENMAVRALLKNEALAWWKHAPSAAAGKSDDALIRAYLQTLVASVKVSDADARTFFEQNRQMFGGAAYDAVESEIRSYLGSGKRQQAIADHIQNLGKRHVIEVNAAWCATQAKTVLDNPVDAARRSGKPALVKFGSKGCIPCDMLAPILEELCKSYAGKCIVLDVQVREEPILAARYGIESIPVQIFFDKNGNEFVRHVGFWPKEKLVEKLAQMGVQ